MPVARLSLDALLASIDGAPPGLGGAPGEGTPVVVVDLPAEDQRVATDLPVGLPAVVIGTTDLTAPESHPAAAACDVVVGSVDPVIEVIVDTVARNPIAALCAAQVLRGSERRTLDEGLFVESVAYSTLQAGPEFAAWRASRERRERRSVGEPVLVERDGGTLHLTLNRPDVGNALSTAMRDALVEALVLPALDATILEVHLRGAGASFCTGGDLDEFGSFADPASAHLVRLQQSVGRSIAAVSDRVVAHLHGSCMGSGIELPAFAGRVVAQPSTVISLPEVSLGLIPGAGGTVSLPRRIGRLRTARLALSGERIDAATARAWGLVDEVEEPVAG